MVHNSLVLRQHKGKVPQKRHTPRNFSRFYFFEKLPLLTVMTMIRKSLSYHEELNIIFFVRRSKKNPKINFPTSTISQFEQNLVYIASLCNIDYIVFNVNNWKIFSIKFFTKKSFFLSAHYICRYGFYIFVQPTR